MAALPEERRLLVAGEPAHGDARSEQLALADLVGGAHDPRQQRPVHIEEGEQVVVPVEPGERAEHRARGVGHVGDVLRPSCQPPDEPAVDRPEGEPVAAAVRRRSHSSFVAEK